MLLTFIALLISNPTFAGERYLLYLGGGGEPANQPGTMFDNGLKSVGEYLKTNSWHADVRFNGGHPTTEGILNTQFSGKASTGPFTVQSYDEMIKKYQDAILNGSVKQGDQLLVMIDSHGAENYGFGQKSHSISVGNPGSKMDLNNLGGSTVMSLDNLAPLVAAAKAKGVKLAIADMSCHSGSSLVLADNYACVISSSGPKHYGYSSFSDDFIQNMKPGRSLENVFLQTRRNENTPSYPMISTPAGKALNELLYQGITPFLFYTNKETDADNLSPYLADSAKSCLSGDSTAPLLSEIEKLKNAVNDSRIDSSELRDLLRQYQRQQDSITATLRSWGAGLLSQVETCQATAKYGKHRWVKYKSKFTWQELIASEFAGNIEYLTQEMHKERNPHQKAELRASIQCMSKNEAKKKEILATHPELEKYGDRTKTLVQQANNTYDLAKKIGIADRKLYQNLYEDISKYDSRPDACKDFVL